MPRYPRAFVAGYPHHIVQRGHNRRTVFAKDEDFRVYLENLAEQKVLLDIRVYAYCLMGNHVHLVVQPDSRGMALSQLMRILAARQTRYVNRLKGRTGTLWEGRFKCSLIDANDYLLACCRYVDLNPVRAGLVARPEEYRWSSYRHRAGWNLTDSWQDLDPAYLGLGCNAEERRSRYRHFVEQGVPEHELNLLRRAVRRNQLTGGPSFTQAIADRIGRIIEARGPGRPQVQK